MCGVLGVLHVYNLCITHLSATYALNDGICQLCDCGNVEDERHFLISCTALNYERRNLYILVSESITDFNLLSDESKFLILMSNPLICKFTAEGLPWNVQNL